MLNGNVHGHVTLAPPPHFGLKMQIIQILMTVFDNALADSFEETMIQ
jgi:hypothetical protein